MATSRRDILVLTCAAAGAGAAALGYRAVARPAPARLRPPGAEGEPALLAACIRCGQCVEACPETTLRLAGLEDGAGAGAPYFVARDVACTMCQERDEPECIRVCPTNALRAVGEVRAIRIGTAVLDEERCWAYGRTVCRACWHACPLPDEAIRLSPRLRPEVDPERCTGCGLCEHACPTEPASITVVPAGRGAA